MHLVFICILICGKTTAGLSAIVSMSKTVYILELLIWVPQSLIYQINQFNGNFGKRFCNMQKYLRINLGFLFVFSNVYQFSIFAFLQLCFLSVYMNFWGLCMDEVWQCEVVWLNHNEHTHTQLDANISKSTVVGYFHIYGYWVTEDHHNSCV